MGQGAGGDRVLSQALGRFMPEYLITCRCGYHQKIYMYICFYDISSIYLYTKVCKDVSSLVCLIVCLLSVQHTESVGISVSATSPTLAGAAKPFSLSSIGMSSFGGVVITSNHRRVDIIHSIKGKSLSNVSPYDKITYITCISCHWYSRPHLTSACLSWMMPVASHLQRL